MHFNALFLLPDNLYFKCGQAIYCQIETTRHTFYDFHSFQQVLLVASCDIICWINMA